MLTSQDLISPDGRFTWPARWFGLKLTLLVPFVHLFLMSFGYHRTLAGLRRLMPANHTATTPNDDAHRFAFGMRRLVRRVAKKSPLPGSCCSRSLVLWWLLGAQGIKTTLHVGTCKCEGEFQAHAWVEYCEQPLNAGIMVTSRYLDFNYNFTSTAI